MPFYFVKVNLIDLMFCLLEPVSKCRMQLMVIVIANFNCAGLTYLAFFCIHRAKPALPSGVSPDKHYLPAQCPRQIGHRPEIIKFNPMINAKIK